MSKKQPSKTSQAIASAALAREAVATLSMHWDSRPRRQVELDNEDDLKWIGALLSAAIKAMPEIRRRFKIEETMPVVKAPVQDQEEA